MKLKSITSFNVNIKNCFKGTPTFTVENDNIQKLLNYNSKIRIDDTVTFKNTLVNITSQLSRLKICTEMLDYKLCIAYDNYLFVVDDNNSIITHYMNKKLKNRVLYTTISIDRVFSKLKNGIDITQNLRDMFDSLLKILKQVHDEQIKLINKYFKDLSIIKDLNMAMKYPRIDIIDKYKESLDNLLEKDRKVKKSIRDINKKTKTDISMDLRNSYNQSFLIDKKNEINVLKETLYENIDKMYKELWNKALLVDEICFEYSKSVNILKDQQKELKKIISIH